MDIRTVLSQGGGSEEWIWKGGGRVTAAVEVIVGSEPILRHRIAFSSNDSRFHLEGETVFSGASDKLPFYSLEDGTLRIRNGIVPDRAISPDTSVLSGLRDPVAFPELSQLAKLYEDIKIYREWPFGRRPSIRSPQSLDQLDDSLDEEFSNLCLFLRRIERVPSVKESILRALKDLYQGITDFGFRVDENGGTIQLFFKEGDILIPTRRLSDGTLHYVCLLAILCDPDPPSLLCIEEPELGLHPDILPKLADLLIEASERTQLIVTTHSDVLVDAMTECPQAVVVCEKREGQTRMKRLSKTELEPWLEDYRLGELWTSGEIGGNRW
jgi:predicted ATPase